MGILPDLYANRRSFGSGGFPYFRTPCSHPIPSLKEPTCIGEGPPMGSLLDLRLLALRGQKFGRPLIREPSPDKTMVFLFCLLK
jgi:hypothetical protein